METRVRTPHDVFFAPLQLLVPLFQRPYVWSREGQWAPLWDDVQRQADRMLATSQVGSPHFLGAVVLQNQAGVVGAMPHWTIIDGQQRLTTLQLLLDAAHQVVHLAGAELAARRIEDVVRNPLHFCTTDADHFKVWPTNRDRAAFNEVMAASLPVDYRSLEHPTSRMAGAHAYFTESIHGWVQEGDTGRRAEVLAHVLLNELQMVVIQLAADEDAQEIFETLNARGTPLTAADLIKNFVFQRLALKDDEAERAYLQYWQEFETAFWEKEVSVGRVILPRSSLFLNQWLVAQTAQDITAREVFSRFKQYAEHDVPMAQLLPRIDRSASVYRQWTEGSERPDGAPTQLELFAYRAGVLESESIKPIMIWATDPNLSALPADEFSRLFRCLESWLVRRSLLRLPTKAYNKFFTDVLRELSSHPRDVAGQIVESVLTRQDSVNTHWPGNDEIRTELSSIPIYRRLRRARLRMLLEAIEDHERGFDHTDNALADARVRRNHCAVEHLMPQRWEANWPIDHDPLAPSRRGAAIHLLGNLTLLTSRLNNRVSNGPWLGGKGKLALLDTKDVLLLNRGVRTLAHDGWDEDKIHIRTQQLIDAIVAIWPVPAGHQGLPTSGHRVDTVSVGIADLLSDGLLTTGQILHAGGRWAPAIATVLADGRLQVGEDIYETPSGAAKAVRKRTTNGWAFWLTSPGGDTSLRDLRTDYSAQFGVEATAEDDSDSGDGAAEQ